MRVTKSQIVNGLTEFVKTDILPKLDGDKAMQIIGTVALHAAAANQHLLDVVFGNSMVRALLSEDGSGSYEIGGLINAMKAAIEQYGYFPVTIPAIPLLSPHEITVRLNASDVDDMRMYIEAITEGGVIE